ncbi:MAG: tetratricopeptide repeat protein [Polyangiales bacterium]
MPPASAEVKQAEQALAAGQLARAEAALQRALTAASCDARAWFDFAELAELRQQHSAAEQRYRRALRCAPRFPEAHNNLGLRLRARDRLRAAKTHFEAALQAWPNYPEAQLNLGLTWRDLGDGARARTAMARAIRLLPKDAEAHIIYAELLLESAQRQQARAVLKQAERHIEDDLPLLYQLGKALRRTGDGTAAAQALQQAITLAGPKAPPALHAEHVLAVWATGERVRAIDLAGALSQAHPNYATAHLLLGKMHAAQGAKSDARRHLKRCVALAPQSPEAQHATALLQQLR